MEDNRQAKLEFIESNLDKFLTFLLDKGLSLNLSGRLAESEQEIYAEIMTRSMNMSLHYSEWILKYMEKWYQADFKRLMKED